MGTVSDPSEMCPGWTPGNDGHPRRRRGGTPEEGGVTKEFRQGRDGMEEQRRGAE